MTSDEGTFLARFEGAWTRLRRVEVVCGVLWALFALAGGLAAIAALDYRFELPAWARTGLLGLFAAAAVVLLVRSFVVPVAWWSRSRTAREIEDCFPELGQRVRTLVPLSSLEDSEIVARGVAPCLLRALLSDTEERSRPIDIAAVIPWRRVACAAVLSGTPALLLLGGALVERDVRTAFSRALLLDREYTDLSALPGDVAIQEGDDLEVQVHVAGRIGRPVLLHVRQTTGGWSERTLDPDSRVWTGDRRLRHDVRWDDVREPFEYRLSIGRISTETYRVQVLRPLRIAAIRVRVSAPAHTGLAATTFETGDFEAVEGSEATIDVQLDRDASEASIALSVPAFERMDDADSRPIVIPMQVAGANLRAVVEAREDCAYSIRAVAREGPGLPENRFSIRVVRNHPPRAWFEEPPEALEVHSLAEVLLRVRAEDDFGLSRVGIRFQVDDGEVQTLVAEEMAAAAGTPSAAGSERTPTREFQIDARLCLEDHRVTPRQSVTYSAFAEDNTPGVARRIETELRFIDIRPFRRVYKIGGT